MTIHPASALSVTGQPPASQALSSSPARFGAAKDSVRFSGKQPAAGKKSFNPVRWVLGLIGSLLGGLLSILGLRGKPEAAASKQGKPSGPAQSGNGESRGTPIPVNVVRSPAEQVWNTVSTQEEGMFWALSNQGAMYNTRKEPYADQVRGILDRDTKNNVVVESDDESLRDGFTAALMNHIGQECQENDAPMPIPVTLGPEEFNEFIARRQFNDPRLQPGFVRKAMQAEADQPVYYIIDNPDWLTTGALTKLSRIIQKDDPNVRFIFKLSKKEMDAMREPFMKEYGAKIEAHLDPTSGHEDTGFEMVTLPPLKNNEWLDVFNNSPMMQRAHEMFIDNAFSESGYNEMLNLLRREKIEPTLGSVLTGLYALGKAGKEQPDAVIDAAFVKDNKDDIAKEIRKQSGIPDAGANEGLQQQPMNQLQQMLGASAFSLVDPSTIKVGLKDVVGLEKAKAELEEFVDHQKYPEYYAELEKDDPDTGKDALLLYGPPGNGKTMLARAVAKDLGASFINSSAQLGQIFMGSDQVNAELLKKAIKESPTEQVVVFVDEIDGAGNRDDQFSNSQSQITQWLQIMEGLDGFDGKQVLFIAATNKRDNLDAGLFERFQHVEVPNPSPEERKQILENQLTYKKLLPENEDTLDWGRIQKLTDDMSGRNLRDIVKRLRKAINRDVPVEVKASGSDPVMPYTQEQLVDAIEDFKTSRQDQKKSGGIGFTAHYDEKSGKLVSA